jgi:diguanylate cyclase (GGDEF)-like protein/PAS domain S-box-containing protein
VTSQGYGPTATVEIEQSIRLEAAHAAIDVDSLMQMNDAIRGTSAYAQDRLRIVAENASDTIYEWDLGTGELEVSGPVQDRLGDLPMPRNYEAWKSMIHPDDVVRVVSELSRYIETGQRYAGEFRLIGRNGRTYHYSNRGQALHNSAGDPYKWIGFATDITEFKIAEEAAWQLAAIVRGSQDGIIGTNLLGAITNWNGGAEELLGYSATEILGKPISTIMPLLDRNILNANQAGVSRIEEAVLVRKDGADAIVSLTTSPIRNTSGEPAGVAVIVKDIATRQNAERELAYQARHDSLTGLPNRLLLADRLEDAIDRSRHSALMAGLIYVDLDGFKFVNESLGHEVGDMLLQSVAKRLSTCVRQGDTLARVGGDEFMLIVTEIVDCDKALAVAERLRMALRKPFLVSEHELYITVSIGISIFPSDGADVSTLWRNADAAMYDAKRGKDQIQFYLPAMRAAFIERLELETHLRHALDRNELVLHYQPMFMASGKRQTSFEALVRWRHPTLGLIAPMRFIPIAEDTGLIGRLGIWVLKEACQQCWLWQERLPGVRVAVNVSALQFARPDFVDSVLGVLTETGLAGNLLELEITETMLMRDMQASILKISALRGSGVRMSIDDFGTGYSSLRYLQNLPIDTLKIDRCFAADIGLDRTAIPLISGMISLAHSIGKRVVVEGVETQRQLNLLRKMKCDEVQGYLLGRPAPLPWLHQSGITVPLVA